MKNPKQLAYAALGLLAVTGLLLITISEQEKTNPPQRAKQEEPDKVEPQVATELEQDVAKNMAVGQVILMASCLGKQGKIPRERMGDYISAAVERQGVSSDKLHEKWDFYWGFAKRAEAREGTSCLQ